MNVHFLQHVSFEGPGYIEVWLKARAYSITVTRLYEINHCLPQIDAVDVLIILGGPMSVYDEHDYPWLHDEKAFIEDCIQRGKHVMGICLGAQLMAVCLGACVYTATNKEIGWFPVMPAEECSAVPWFYELFKAHPIVLHWHGDKFDIPYDGSLNLLSSEANTNQAFMKGNKVIGLQFHLETTPDTLQSMLQHIPETLNESIYIQQVEQLNEGLVHMEDNHKLMAALLGHWLEDGFGN